MRLLHVRTARRIQRAYLLSTIIVTRVIAPNLELMGPSALYVAVFGFACGKSTLALLIGSEP